MFSIVIGSDHAGFTLKQELMETLRQYSFEPVDVGTHDTQPVDYPDVARGVGEAIQNRMVNKGVLICGSGVGASVAANKLRGVRAGLCHDTYSAHQGVEHDDMNVICLGSRVVGPEVAKELVLAFLKAEFTGGDRHVRRLNKVRELEKNFGVPEGGAS